MVPEQTVFVVDDDAAVRDGIRALLNSIHLSVETYANAQDFLAAYERARGGCLVVDLRMPGMSGLELQEHLVDQGVALPVIFITGYAEVATAVRAMKNGALDFFQKPFSNQELLDRIQHALQRDAQARAGLAKRLELTSRLSRLTGREQEVLKKVVDGKANKIIALDLGISVKTVEAFRAKIMEKMQAGSLAELVRLVLTAWGEFPPPDSLTSPVAS